MSKPLNRTCAFLHSLHAGELKSLAPVAVRLGVSLQHLSVPKLKLCLELFHSHHRDGRMNEAQVLAGPALAKQMLENSIRDEVLRYLAWRSPEFTAAMDRHIHGNPAADELRDRQGLIGVCLALMAYLKGGVDK